MEKVAFGVQKL